MQETGLAGERFVLGASVPKWGDLVGRFVGVFSGDVGSLVLSDASSIFSSGSDSFHIRLHTFQHVVESRVFFIVGIIFV